MRGGLSALFTVLICALAAVAGGAQPALAHSDRPGPILRIDRRLADAEALTQRRQVRLLLRRARFSRQSGNASAALADLDRARSLGASGRFFDYEQGLSLAMVGRDADAASHLDRFLATGTPNALALNARARLYEHAGETEAAAAAYARSLERRDDVEIYLARGRVLQAAEHCDEAARTYREGLARIGKAELLERALVSALSACGQHVAALAAIEAHLRSSRAATDWLLLRGDVLVASGDLAGAHEARKQALENAEQALARKKSAILYYERARAHAALGDVSEARADLERVLRATNQFQPALDLAKTLNVATGSIVEREMRSPQATSDDLPAETTTVAAKE